jgi:hypothetical protein
MNGFKRFLARLNIYSFLIKTKTDENEDPNEYLPPASKYDPRVDYDDLAWKAYYRTHKGEPFAEEAKKIIESLQ